MTADRQAAALDRLRAKGLGLAPHMVDGRVVSKRSGKSPAARPALGASDADQGSSEGITHAGGYKPAEGHTARFGLWIPAPGKFLSLNDRMHHHPKAKLVKAWRTAAREAAEAGNMPTGLDRVHIAIDVLKTNGRAYDVHNLMPTAKACIDGLIDAGLCADDNNDYLTGPDMRAGGVADWAGLRIVVTVLA